MTKKGQYKLKKSEISRSCSSWRLTEVVGLSCVSHTQYAENLLNPHSGFQKLEWIASV